jgi:hypothetical protein
MNKKFIGRLSVEDRGQLEPLVAKGSATLSTSERSPSIGSAARSSKLVLSVPSSGVPYRVARGCSMASRRPALSPWPAQARRRAGAAGRSVSWPASWSDSAMSPRSPIRPSVGRSKNRAEAMAGQDVVHPAQGQRRVRLEDGGCPPCLQASVRSAPTGRLHGRNQQATHRGDTAAGGCGAGSASPRGLPVPAQKG